MTREERFWTNPDIGALILRVTIGGLLFLHGLHKITAGIENQTNLLEAHGIPGQLMGFIYLSEVLAPVLIVLGVFTRLSALSILMTMVTILFVIPAPLLGLNEHGASNIELQLFYLLTPLVLFFTGPGRYRVRSDNDRHWLLE